MRFRRRKAPIISVEEREKKRFPWGKVIYFGIIGAIVIGFGVWGFQKLIFIKGRGVLEAEAIKVESKLNARIVEIRPKINERVSKGEPVVFLDKTGLEAQLSTRDAQIDRQEILSRYELVEAKDKLQLVKQERKNQEEWVKDLRGEYDRAKRLLALEAITRPQFLEIENNLKLEERNLSTISTGTSLANETYDIHKEEHDYYRGLLKEDKEKHQKLIQETVLVSPIDGIATKIYKQVGEMALKGEPVIAIADPSKLFIKTYFDESDEGKIHVGEKARIVFESGEKYDGEIRLIYRASHALPKIYRGYYEDREAPIVAEVTLLTDKPPDQTIGTRADVFLRRSWF